MKYLAQGQNGKVLSKCRSLVLLLIAGLLRACFNRKEPIPLPPPCLPPQKDSLEKKKKILNYLDQLANISFTILCLPVDVHEHWHAQKRTPLARPEKNTGLGVRILALTLAWGKLFHHFNKWKNASD